MPHVSMITIGVADVARSRAFYEALGWRASSASQEEIVFLQGPTAALALFGWDALAEDAQVPAQGSGFRGMALAMNVPTEYAVDEALVLAEQAGATITKRGQATEWGGYSGYFTDPDGHLWEVANNPIVPLDESGRMALPD